MTMVKKSITVTDQQEAWIQAQIAAGNYGTDSELIREALREKQLRIDEVDYIRAKLIKAVKVSRSSFDVSSSSATTIFFTIYFCSKFFSKQ